MLPGENLASGKDLATNELGAFFCRHLIGIGWYRAFNINFGVIGAVLGEY